MLALYSHPNSTYTHRVLICLAYKDLPFEKIHVALERLENRKKPFLMINPYGKVPVLKDEDFFLSESTAIMRYVEEKFPESRRAIPTTIRSRALMNQFANLCETDFCFPGSSVYFAKKFVKEEKWDLNRMKESSKKISRHLDNMDTHLSTQDFMVDNEFGFLEIMYAPFIHNIGTMDVTVPNFVQRWIDRVLNQKNVNSVING